jgi:hypothetical protein
MLGGSRVFKSPFVVAQEGEREGKRKKGKKRNFIYSKNCHSLLVSFFQAPSFPSSS